MRVTSNFPYAHRTGWRFQTNFKKKTGKQRKVESLVCVHCELCSDQWSSDARFKPMTASSAVWCSTKQPPHLVYQSLSQMENFYLLCQLFSQGTQMEDVFALSCKGQYELLFLQGPRIKQKSICTCRYICIITNSILYKAICFSKKWKLISPPPLSPPLGLVVQYMAPPLYPLLGPVVQYKAPHLSPPLESLLQYLAPPLPPPLGPEVQSSIPGGVVLLLLEGEYDLAVLG